MRRGMCDPKTRKIVMWVSCPQHVTEDAIDEAVADAIFNAGGEVIEVLPHEDDGLYHGEDGEYA